MITIYSKDTCPYCDMAKQLLTDLNIDFIEVDLSWRQDEIINLANMSWYRTLPQIYVWEVKKENLIWWYSDIKKLNDEWKLIEILNKN